MSRILINTYLAEIDRLRTVSGSVTESVVREAFKDLLKDWARGENLFFVAELEYETGMRTRVVPDGTIVHGAPCFWLVWGSARGYWPISPLAADLSEGRNSGSRG